MLSFNFLGEEMPNRLHWVAAFCCLLLGIFFSLAMVYLLHLDTQNSPENSATQKGTIFAVVAAFIGLGTPLALGWYATKYRAAQQGIEL